MSHAPRWTFPACLVVASLIFAGVGTRWCADPDAAVAAPHRAVQRHGKPRCPNGAVRKRAGRPQRQRSCPSREPRGFGKKAAKLPVEDSISPPFALGAEAATPQAPPPPPPPAGSETPNPIVEAPEQPPAKAPFRLFSASSPWNEAASNAAVDPLSPAIVASFLTEISRERLLDKGPTINTLSYSVPIYTVPAEQPMVQVGLAAAGASTLRSSWSQVPLPPDAHPANGSDGHLVLWQPSTDRLWEFWRLVHDETGWRASWGGSMQDVSSSSGVYGPEAWPGATRWWGASACSLSIAGGVITLEDFERGEIDHALAISTPNIRAGVFALPAQRTDGRSSDPLSLPEGAHLRLDPSLDLSSLQLSPVTLMLAEAAQRYGIFVRDGAPAVTSFYAQDPTALGSNPYPGPSGYFQGKSPSQLAAAFPWGHLELLSAPLGSLS
jgi:hypothetical protein